MTKRKDHCRRFTWLLTGWLALTVINYPNPANPLGGQLVTFECTGAATGEAQLYIYDMAARLKRRISFPLQGGNAINRTSWNGYSESNEPVGTGIYLYQLIGAGQVRLGKGKIVVVNR